MSYGSCLQRRIQPAVYEAPTKPKPAGKTRTTLRQVRSRREMIEIKQRWFKGPIRKNAKRAEYF